MQRTEISQEIFVCNSIFIAQKLRGNWFFQCTLVMSCDLFQGNMKKTIVRPNSMYSHSLSPAHLLLFVYIYATYLSVIAVCDRKLSVRTNTDNVLVVKTTMKIYFVR